MNLEKKITKLTIAIFIAVIFIISIFSLAIINKKVSQTMGKSLTDTAFVIAANPMIQKELVKINLPSPTFINFTLILSPTELKATSLEVSVETV